MTAHQHASAIAELRALLALQPQRPAAQLAAEWRSQHALIEALPPRYGQVLESLLARLESAAMFGEESCSFSASDLRGELGVWLDRAEHALG